MITQAKFNRIIWASAILVGSLFLSIAWKYFVDENVDYTFPYVDFVNGYRDGFLSWNPEEPKILPRWVIIPYFVDSIIPVFYILAFMIVGKMKHPNLGNMWMYYALFQLMMAFDFFLTMKMIPFRSGAILGVICLQFHYIYWAYGQIGKK